MAKRPLCSGARGRRFESCQAHQPQVFQEVAWLLDRYRPFATRAKGPDHQCLSEPSNAGHLLLLRKSWLNAELSVSFDTSNVARHLDGLPASTRTRILLEFRAG